MAKILVFLREEKNRSDLKRLNEDFKVLVKAFVYLTVSKDSAIAEYFCNSKMVRKVFDNNPDCELVFSITKDQEIEREISKRNIMAYEWSKERMLIPVN